MERIVKAITEADTVLVGSHQHPDGDALGSLLAMGKALAAAGKQVVMANESPIPAVYRFLPASGQIVRQVPQRSYDLAVALDCGSVDRLGRLTPAFEAAGTLVNIDHHVTNKGFGDLQLVRPQACATAELVYELICRLQVPVDADMATAIYTAILTDTGSFRFSNTNQAAFAICAEMVRCGADPYQVSRRVYGTYSLGRIKLLNLALDSIEVACDGKLSIMTVTRQMMDETQTQAEDLDGLINYARRIEDVQVAALIHELGPAQAKAAGDGTRRFHVSLRSEGAVDVSKIAAAFDGGGHESAAGFNAETTLEALKRQLIQLAENAPAACERN